MKMLIFIMDKDKKDRGKYGIRMFTRGTKTYLDISS